MVSCTDENRLVVPPILGTLRSQMISLTIIIRVLMNENISGENRQVVKMYKLPVSLSFGTAASIHA